MINFDNKGNIFPYEITETTFEIFQEVFSFNEHRKAILQEYVEFCSVLKSIQTGEFFQFVDGSFVTQKQYPKDIDIVTFMDADFFNKNAVKLLNLRDNFEKIDCFFVPNHSPEHPHYFVTQFGLFEWEQLFNTDREYHPKGIIKITF